MAFLSDAEQGAGVLVEDGPGGAGVDLGVVDVIDRADKYVPVFVGEVGSGQEAVRAECWPEGSRLTSADAIAEATRRRHSPAGTAAGDSAGRLADSRERDDTEL